MSFTLLLFLLLFGGMIFFVRRKKGERGFVGSIEHHSEGTVPSVRFADIAANEEALESLHDILSFIRLPEQYSRFGARTPRGVLLYGLPGTGKTLMARALAGEAGVPFFAVNGADFVEMYVGVGASRIRALFKSARKAGHAVIFFDEIDAIGKKRDNRSDEREQTLNALLSEMSGFREGDGVVVLAATNRVDTLDEALLRAGRFDRHIEVPLPGYEERVKILEVHARNKPLGADVSLPELAAQTALFSGAKLEGVLNEAAIFA
ncbi:MAG: AAA family ATPase, partial [Clostridia bacterium]